MKTLTGIALWMTALCGIASADWQPLWPEGAPGGAKPVVVTESEGEGGRLADTAVPQYEVYLPQPGGRTGSAVVILPGGGYTILAMEHEGRAYAKWLSERGIVAVLVKYRVSQNDAAGFQFPVPLLDARRAIRVTRTRAKEWGVDPGKIGIMGSSAGGHLASMCATLWSEKFSEENSDDLLAVSCRPDFAVLVYPVITMKERWTHAGSKRRLLGEHPEPALTARVSSHLQVTPQTPPCFLVHAADDGAVPVRNSLEFTARCAENKVPVVCHVFSRGGHGFGINGREDSAAWAASLEAWLIDRNLAAAPAR